VTIKGLNHITFAVADMEKSTEFYTQVLGAALVLAGPKTVYMDLAGIWLALNLEPGRPKALENYTHMAFSVEVQDINLYKQRLVDKGIELKEDRPRHPDEGQSLYFRDPDGHLLELHTKTRAERIDFHRRTRLDLQFIDGGNDDG
jgi:metallothiol transferase